MDQYGVPEAEEKYELLEFINRGSFGDVHKVRRKNDGAIYAMKVMPPSEIQGSVRERMHAQALEEARLFKGLPKCEHLVRCEEYFSSPTYVLVIMEYVDGNDLCTCFANRTLHFTEANCKLYIRQILMGVCSMHEREMVHLDLKLDNALVHVREDGTALIKLTDFGFTKQFRKEDVLMNRLGTKEYMSPEIILRSQCGKPADMWAIGIILYAILRGRFPFGVKLIERGITASHIHRGLNLRRLLPGVSDECRDFIRRLLVADPNARMKIMDALEHKWFKETRSTEEEELDLEALRGRERRTLLLTHVPYLPQMFNAGAQICKVLEGFGERDVTLEVAGAEEGVDSVILLILSDEKRRDDVAAFLSAQARKDDALLDYIARHELQRIMTMFHRHPGFHLHFILQIIQKMCTIEMYREMVARFPEFVPMLCEYYESTEDSLTQLDTASVLSLLISNDVAAVIMIGSPRVVKKLLSDLGNMKAEARMLHMERMANCSLRIADRVLNFACSDMQEHITCAQLVHIMCTQTRFQETWKACDVFSRTFHALQSKIREIVKDESKSLPDEFVVEYLCILYDIWTTERRWTQKSRSVEEEELFECLCRQDEIVLNRAKNRSFVSFHWEALKEELDIASFELHFESRAPIVNAFTLSPDMRIRPSNMHIADDSLIESQFLALSDASAVCKGSSKCTYFEVELLRGLEVHIGWMSLEMCDIEGRVLPIGKEPGSVGLFCSQERVYFGKPFVCTPGHRFREGDRIGSHWNPADGSVRWFLNGEEIRLSDKSRLPSLYDVVPAVSLSGGAIAGLKFFESFEDAV
eukprot:TRINITY_DN1290_c0_g1_i1.p1 TRINITY_DN1290_c0_g1~~TRINITY_DN1290_c0_g1_i1.p1  ORF type:complete len:862 (-),score=234.52 TRINITY_DN1290_c0_g1_i1:1112-3547(-)